MDHASYFADNLANWNDRVPIHAGPDGYGVDRFVADRDRLSSIVEVDRRYLGDVSGASLLHLQCHIGTDTLSWAKLGASVTGVDFSGPALAVASAMAAELGLDATFVESDLYEAPVALGRTYDIVYTGVGAINWLPDIRRWAEVVAACTRPGGTFYMREGHPVLWALDWEREDDGLELRVPYFETEQPFSWSEEATYLGTGSLDHPLSHSWNHGLGEIVTALLAVGFRIDLFEEHRFLDWKALPHMVSIDDDRWALPDHQRDLAPLMYSLRATLTTD